ncbi:efflux RND transporter periplasmic adaptor subunit [Candidatus Berkiella aquae]|uniref:Cobalt-zinc-cadmium resistance protein CzcB n=1 Tax=Candidatus Berkiella aquae TaxID=295108 RepID=A0A0Q9YTI5_9GAMM|nr:efflux RND transporter periplasmic adaptor subunit [Candidatus Berkiella aquae]MCS5712804.1 efflux RND transporter periplasmic adaptor subunit [Candidatus Berkiella aquae]
MNRNQKYFSINAPLVVFVFLFSFSVFSEDKHNDSPEKNVVILTKEAQETAGIKIDILNPQVIKGSIPVPGEVIPNEKLTNKVTVRVSAQVIKRHVQEGEHVKEGQILATLSSVDMAKVQGDLLLAAQEWQRVKLLGTEAISGKRYTEAQVAYQHAYSTAAAYGLTESEINTLLGSQKPSQAKGDFNLIAPRNGTAFNVNFNEGELIEPGRVLLQVVDEATVWIDAKLPPDLKQPVKIGDAVKISVNSHTLPGRIIQIHHQLDETTRTRSTRIEVANTQDMLHPGQYVNCNIEGSESSPVMALPVSSVLRTADGDWAIYVEVKPDHFQQVEVKVIKITDNQAIIEGVSSGLRVVTNGAFFVHSELNKRGFDAHNH